MLYVLKIIFSGTEDLDLPGRLPVHQHLRRNKRAAVRPVADDLSRGLVAAGQILQYRKVAAFDRRLHFGQIVRLEGVFRAVEPLAAPLLDRGRRIAEQPVSDHHDARAEDAGADQKVPL